MHADNYNARIVHIYTTSHTHLATTIEYTRKKYNMHRMGVIQVEHVCRSCHQIFRSPYNLKVHTRNAVEGTLKRCDGKKRSVHKSRKSDQYNTPEWMWRDLVNAYPALSATKVWDPFFNDGKSTGLIRCAGMKKVKVQA